MKAANKTACDRNGVQLLCDRIDTLLAELDKDQCDHVHLRSPDRA